MEETIYIFTSGTLKRKDNTLLFETEDKTKKYIPVENVKEIFAFGEIDINKRLLGFLSEKEITLSYFNYYGYYMGTFYPREHYNSGYMILRQAEFYMDIEKRMIIARQFVTGAVKNTLKIMKYYDRRGKDLKKEIDIVEELMSNIDNQESVATLMATEGQIKQAYYRTLNSIIDSDDFSFTRRSKRPPKDYLNALISFANSMIYVYALNEIYRTHLDPRIGFLHTSNFRRFSLNLDIAEIFKPVIGDRTIFSVINKKKITKRDFDNDLKGILLNDSGKRKFLESIEERLKQTIEHSKIGKKVSYRRFVRLELYKLEKHLMGEELYEPFVMDW